MKNFIGKYLHFWPIRSTYFESFQNRIGITIPKLNKSMYSLRAGMADLWPRDIFATQFQIKKNPQFFDILRVFPRGGHSRGYPIDLLIDFLYGTVGRN
jgi:hypothetical protein